MKFFLQLDESSRMNLYLDSFDDSSIMKTIKTRSESGGEIGKDECKRRLDEDYTYASAIYLAAMVGCSCATGGIGVCFCAIAASAAYDYAITLADRSYYDCMSNAI